MLSGSTGFGQRRAWARDLKGMRVRSLCHWLPSWQVTLSQVCSSAKAAAPCKVASTLNLPVGLIDHIFPCPFRLRGNLLALGYCTNGTVPPRPHTFAKSSSWILPFCVCRLFPAGTMTDKILYITDIIVIAPNSLLWRSKIRFSESLSRKTYALVVSSTPLKRWSPKTAPLPSRGPQTQIPCPEPEQENGAQRRAWFTGERQCPPQPKLHADDECPEAANVFRVALTQPGTQPREIIPNLPHQI